MDRAASDVHAKRRRLVFVLSASVGAIERLDSDDLDELGLITRLQEIVEMVESNLDELINPD